MSDVIIWHNPRCSKSRETLALLHDRGIAPVVRRYLDDAPSLDELRAARHQLNLPALHLMRVKEARFAELGLSGAEDDETLLRAMVENPVLIERPMVFANGKAAIGRPPQAVLALIQGRRTTTDNPATPAPDQCPSGPGIRK